MKKIGWIAGVFWIAFATALFRGMEYGVHLKILPSLMFAALVFGGPGYILVFGITKGEGAKRFRAACLSLVLGLFAGSFWMSFEEARFKNEVAQAGEVDMERRRWWPLQNYTLTHSEGHFSAYD